MNVSLTSELEEFVNQKVQSGMYFSASEVIREGLRLLKDQDALKEMRLKELRKEIQKGIDSLERGEGTTYSNAGELAEKIKRQGRERLRNSKKAQGAP